MWNDDFSKPRCSQTKVIIITLDASRVGWNVHDWLLIFWLNGIANIALLISQYTDKVQPDSRREHIWWQFTMSILKYSKA